MNKKDFIILTPFKRWVIQEFPFIEEDFDAITNYQLYSKIVEYLNKVIANEKLLEQSNNELIDAFNSLKEYVDNFFDNLDIQEEVNNKLDEMADSGQLTDIIAQYLGLAGVLAYNTIDEMQEAENLTDGSICYCLGNTLYNDGEGSFYKVREVLNTDVIDGFNIVALDVSESLIAERITSQVEKDVNYLIKREYDVKLFGAKGDGITDDTEAFEEALDTIDEDNGGVLLIPEGTYIIDRCLKIPSNTTLKGLNKNSILKASDDFDTDNPSPVYKSLITLKYMTMNSNEQEAEKNITIQDLTFDNNGQSNAGHDGIIQLRGLNDSYIHNVKIQVNGTNCWGLIVYSANKNLDIDNIIINNTSEDNSAGGCLWVRSGLANVNEGTKTYGVNITNSIFTSTAKDEIVCFSDGLTGGWTEVNMSNCTLIGKATTTYSSYGLVLNCVGDNTSYLKAIVSNLSIFGKFLNYAIVTGSSGINAECTNLNIDNVNIETSAGGGVRSYYKEQIFNNCKIKVPTTSKGCYNITLKNSEVNSTVENSYVDSCIIKISDNTMACENCPVVSNSIIETQGYGIHSYGAVSTKNLNNIIKSGLNGISLQNNGTTGAKDVIISNNIISRLINTSNSGTKGIYCQYAENIVITNNIITGVYGNTSGNYYGFQYTLDTTNTSNKVEANNCSKYLPA